MLVGTQTAELIAALYSACPTLADFDLMPTIMGRTLTRGDSIGAWYLHAWIWKPNPSGLFADWNPRVACRKS